MMRFRLIASAVLFAALAQPAFGRDLGPPRGGPASGFGGAGGVFCSHGRDGDGRLRCRPNRVDQTVVLPFGYYDDRFASRTWEADSYNDWWHDRPDRSFPRWMQNNERCQRMWWSGTGWTC